MAEDGFQVCVDRPMGESLEAAMPSLEIDRGKTDETQARRGREKHSGLLTCWGFFKLC